jgi:hypothetical protein
MTNSHLMIRLCDIQLQLVFLYINVFYYINSVATHEHTPNVYYINKKLFLKYWLKQGLESKER